MNTRLLVLITMVLLAKATCHAAVFMDITSISPGLAGVGTGFSGTLDGVAFTGALTGPPSASINPVGPGIGGSEIADSSPQWSYPVIYTPFESLADKVGVTYTPGLPSALLSIAFASPMTDLILNIANLDTSVLDFSFMIAGGLTGITPLSGNGGPLDGLTASGVLVSDADPFTTDATLPGSVPPIAGSRSAYGSVLLSGTYSILEFEIKPTVALAADSFSFTLSTPEPGIASLTFMGFMGMILRRRRSIQ